MKRRKKDKNKKCMERKERNKREKYKSKTKQAHGEKKDSYTIKREIIVYLRILS